MAFSKLTYTYSGTNLFVLNFTLGYLSEDHVTARVNGEVDGGLNPVYRTITFVSATTGSIDGTLTNGDSVVFERNTPKTELQHDYSDGEVLNEANLDASHLQAIMLVHETLDGRFTSPFEDELDMGANKIVNVLDGVDDQDVVTVAQLTASTGGSGISAAASAASAAAALVSETNAAASAALVPLANYTATTDPIVTSDTNAGYSVGSVWINVTLDTSFVCVDATAGAAVWGNTAVIIGTTVQAWDADLDALAGLTSAANKIPMFSGAAAATVIDLLDEDSMSSDSTTAVATQQSVKKYVDDHALHDSVQAWVKVTYSAGVPTASGSLNIASLDDNGTGDIGVNFTTPFTTANYAVVIGPTGSGSGNNVDTHSYAQLSTNVEIICRTGGVDADINAGIACFGDL